MQHLSLLLIFSIPNSADEHSVASELARIVVYLRSVCGVQRNMISNRYICFIHAGCTISQSHIIEIFIHIFHANPFVLLEANLLLYLNGKLRVSQFKLKSEH